MKVTKTGYDKIISTDSAEGSGWELRSPTKTTVQMGAAASASDLVSITRYNTLGQVIVTRLPAGAAGGDARSTVTAYYTAAGTGACVGPALAGMVCSVGPAAQPTSGSPLPVTTTTTYNFWGQPLVVTETFGVSTTPTTRVTTTTYDGAGRVTGTGVVVTPAASGGEVLPVVSYGYDTGTGLPTTVRTTVGTTVTTVTTGYDPLGRPSAYVDADGVRSTTSFDVLGRPVSTFDGKATTTYTYDGTDANGLVERRGKLTELDAGLATAGPGMFTGAYGPDGELTLQGLPNGLQARTRRDNTGNETALTYKRAADAAPWLAFAAAYGVDGKMRTQTGPQSDQNFGYDNADRLIKVQDNAAAGVGGVRSCTTRAYGFDANSNRTSLSTFPAGTGGVCATTTTPVVKTSTFDSADRLTDPGTAYDVLGRTTTMAAGSVTGGVDATAGYYANDLVRSLTQGTTSKVYGLDPAQNRVRTVTTTVNGVDCR